MSPIRVLVVEDSLTVRRRICDVLTADPAIAVIGEATDGKQAIELCRQLRPDIVTMDMIMPVMSGLAATEYIMAHCPTPILVVSSSFNRGELFKTYDALAAGAVDVLEKPTGTEPEGAWEANLLRQVKLVSKIAVITHPRLRLAELGQQRPTKPTPPERAVEVLAIGASTGGPAAIVTVLDGLPVAFQRPILLVLHINEPFGLAFAEWLDRQTARRVSYACDGDPIESIAGKVAMAPPGHHLVVRDRRLRVTDDPERNFCRPSVDVLFESVAREYRGASAGIILTGMGRDGAEGLLAIRRAGGMTIAQDEASSVVYGMPHEAVRLGAAESVLPLDAIGPALGTIVGGKFEERR